MLIVLNNKSNFIKEEFEEYERKLNELESSCELILCPSTIYLNSFSSKSVFLGAQNVSKNKMGPHTGETSAEQLKSLNVKYCLVGHSERRLEERELDQDINLKIKNLLCEGIIPILCVGETKKEREKAETTQVINCELILALEGLSDSLKEKVIIAYEPIWCIGTNTLPTNSEVELALKEIKRLLPHNKVLYGGSVNEASAVTLAQSEYISGFLLGGLSLDPLKIKLLLENLKKQPN